MALTSQIRIVDLAIMRILVLSDLYPPHFVGGYELKCKLHTEELMRRGHDVFVLTSNWGVGRKDAFVEHNVSRSLRTGRKGQSARLPKKMLFINGLMKRFDQLKRAFASRKNYTIARNTISTVKPDLVYAWQLDDVSIGPVLAAQDQGIPIIYRLDDYWLANLKKEICFDSVPMKRRFRAIINGLKDFNNIDFSHMLVVSRSVKKSYVEVGFTAQTITVMPEGVLSDIILDITIELTLRFAPTWSVLWVCECKHYTKAIPVDDLEEFKAKLDKIAGKNVKGTLAISGNLQASALKYAISNGIEIIIVEVSSCIHFRGVSHVTSLRITDLYHVFGYRLDRFFDCFDPLFSKTFIKCHVRLVTCNDIFGQVYY